MNKRPRPRWAWLFFVQLALVLGASALATTGHLPITVFQSPLDKLGHLFAYGGLSFLGVAFFGGARSTPVVVTLLGAAGLEELSQRLFPTRTFDVGDLAMNVIGISIFGAAAAVALAPRRRARDEAGAEPSVGVDSRLRRQVLEEEELQQEVARARRSLAFERAATRYVPPAHSPFDAGLAAFVIVFAAAVILRCAGAP